MDHTDRYQNILKKINQYTSGEQGITRIAYSNVEQACTHAFMRMCKDAKMEVRLDQAGNLIARRDGKNNLLPPVVIGSHLDTVYNGGKYDGAVGVTSALEVIHRLNEKEIITDHPIEIISFACEESSRFGVATVGSKAMAGTLEKERYRNLKDRDGITMEKVFSLCALDLNQIDQSSRVHETFKVFLEIHIEQGPVLEMENKSIGIVTGIAAPARFIARIQGKPSHSGTTPMHLRKDALLGAAEIALELEKAAVREEEYGTVATVGVFDVKPGAMNVVPGETEIKIDIRSTSKDSRERVLSHLYTTVSSIQKRRGLNIALTEISMDEPVLLSQEVIYSIEQICAEKGLSYRLMQSGAGHDAMNMMGLGPVGLIFIPSEGGISHNPSEYTKIEDILTGIELLEAAVLKYASDFTDGIM